MTGENENGEPNNFLYHDVNIDIERINKLPENGNLVLTDFELNVTNYDNENDGETDLSDFEDNNNNVPDLGPINVDDERVIDKNNEMGSFIPTKTQIGA